MCTFVHMYGFVCLFNMFNLNTLISSIVLLMAIGKNFLNRVIADCIHVHKVCYVVVTACHAMLVLDLVYDILLFLLSYSL